MVLTCLLAQIVNNFKDLLSFKEIQKIPSVKFYSKVILYGSSCLSLSIISAISQTLSYELDVFSQLSVKERFCFLSALKKSFFLNQPEFSDLKVFAYSQDPFNLYQIRRKLSLQFRSSLLSTSLVYSNSLVMGLPIDQVDLDIILYSSKLLWVSLGLLEEDFNFMLLKNFGLLDLQHLNNDSMNESIRSLCRHEFATVIDFKDFLVFNKDLLLFNSYDNMVPLERELFFLRRNYFELSPVLFS